MVLCVARVFWIMTIASIVMVSRIFPSNIVEPSMSLAAFLSWFYLLLFLQRYFKETHIFVMPAVSFNLT